ncbi:MAG: MoaD/ThiS family protein [Archaeoglobaceae archaeon]
MRLRLKFVGFDREEVEIEAPPGKTFYEVIEELGINPETVVIVKDSKPIPTEARVEEGEFKVMRVISGG